MTQLEQITNINNAENIIVKLRADIRWHPADPMPEGLRKLLRVQAYINRQRASVLDTESFHE